MIKPILILTLNLIALNIVFAQKADTTNYYFKNSGKMVSVKDSADYILIISPADTNINKHLNVVKGYYIDGKIKFISNIAEYPLNKSSTIKFQGTYVSFYPNGNKMMVRTFNNGIPIGDVTKYYPNGRQYAIVNYNQDRKLYLKQCNDSTGVALAENGNGKWIDFNQNLNKVDERGQIVDGLKEGEWYSKKNDSLNYIHFYKKNELKYSATSDNFGKIVYSMVDTAPVFPGGLEALFSFLGHNIHYPVTARQRNIQGRVIVTLIIEKDGSVSDVKTVRGIGGGCDEEAVRVLKLSPLWKPGLINGNPVSTIYSIPISFTLSKN